MFSKRKNNRPAAIVLSYDDLAFALWGETGYFCISMYNSSIGCYNMTSQYNCDNINDDDRQGMDIWV